MKADIRRTMIAQRKALPAHTQQAAADALAVTLPAWLSDNHLESKVIAGYHAVNGELDVLPALTQLASGGYQTALPCVQAGSKRLIFKAWQAGDALVAGAYNIQQPAARAPELTPDILLVPLVAMDRHKNRLGYGGGYYDVTIAQLRQVSPALLAIGIGYDFQRLDTLPSEPHDAPLDALLTPSGMLSGMMR